MEYLHIGPEILHAPIVILVSGANGGVIQCGGERVVGREWLMMIIESRLMIEGGRRVCIHRLRISHGVGHVAAAGLMMIWRL